MKKNLKLKAQMSNLKLKTKNLIKSINNIFIQLILFIFYFSIFGLISLLYKITMKKSKEKTYWDDSLVKDFSLNDFQSAY